MDEVFIFTNTIKEAAVMTVIVVEDSSNVFIVAEVLVKPAKIRKVKENFSFDLVLFLKALPA